MDAFARHVVIVGGPEEQAELLSIVLDDGEAIPVFDSMEEATTFLSSTGAFGEDWSAQEVSAGELVELLEFQGEEVRYVALSPPPERLEGGMEVQVVEREAFTVLLQRQPGSRAQSEEKSLWRRLLGR